MTIAFFLSLLLLGTPVQSVEDSSEVQHLQKKVEVLESRIAEHEAKTESFTDILSSQRWTFGAAITFITVLVTVLFGLVGWSIFEWRADYIESDLKDKVEDESSVRSDEVKRLENRLDKIESSFEAIEHWRKGEDIRRFRQLGYYPMSLLLQVRLINEDVTERGLTESEKVNMEIEALEYDLNKIKEISSEFTDEMRAEVISELSSISDRVSGKTEENLKSVLETMKEDF